jgi:ABC-type multidrug transport system ATPase subunit
MSALRIEKLVAGYGASTVLHGIDLTVNEGESVAVVGRNGAGKSTLLLSVFRETNIISGAIWVHDQGWIVFPGYMAAKLGISIAPQGPSHPAQFDGQGEPAAQQGDGQGGVLESQSRATICFRCSRSAPTGPAPC